jgi:hypothetical protein
MSINKHLFWERKLEKLLKSHGFAIKITYGFGKLAAQPDFVAIKGNKTAIIELKVSNIITEKTLYQIMYYQNKIVSDLAYLALPHDCLIKDNIKNKLLENNIGVIRVYDQDLVFEEPQKESNLSTDDLVKYELYSNNKSTDEQIRETRNEIKNISIELFLYISTGGLLVYAVSKLLEFYFEPPGYLWILLVICFIGILIIFIIYSIKINGLVSRNDTDNDRV